MYTHTHMHTYSHIHTYTLIHTQLVINTLLELNFKVVYEILNVFQIQKHSHITHQCNSGFWFIDIFFNIYYTICHTLTLYLNVLQFY